MARISSKSNYLRFLSLSLLSLSCFCSANNENRGGFKGMFVFGSSVVDNGNNNNVNEITSKANFLPYGIDFVDGPTGRFSNGKNVADLIGGHLKLPLIPSFASQQTQQNSNVDAFLHGVNYGSGGSGILNETGSILGKVINFHEQVTNFEGSTLPRLENRLRSPRKKILRNYLFLIAAGNNDYTFHLFFPGQTPPQFPRSDAESFAANLLANYILQLKRLYKLGARNFVLLAPFPLGCTPAISRGRGCLPDINAYISVFHNQLISKIRQMKREMPGSEFVILNSVKVISDILTNGNSTGLSNVNDPCCELSSNGSSCKVNGTPCADRNSYAFFDVIHYTEAASAAIAAKVYGSRNASDVFPANLYRLAKRPRSIIH